jgi:uncharacterized RDD family membrane protein YckC
MKTPDSKSVFNPHETARAEALAGVALAPFSRRLAAYAIDIFLVCITYGPALLASKYLIEGVLHLKENLYDSDHVHVRLDFHLMGELAWTLWLILYFGLIVWKTNGLTPGKRLLRIRIVSLEHDKITLWQSIERALGYGASMLEGGFGFIQYFLYPNHRCVHDRIAETIVIRGPAPTKPQPLIATDENTRSEN